jgi:3',5'-cyclic AMP phosphodiesterase CpdA
MKIAHLSDLHCLALDGVPARRFLNKRLTGWANIRLKRGSIHRTAYVHAIAREIARRGVDHVVVTGDLTNLALDGEFELARDVLEHELAFDAAKVTIVPGNHDTYTRGAVTTRRFERHFGPWLASDLPDLAVDVGGTRMPVVKLRGEVAIVALSSAVPQPPLVAAGELGGAQLAALSRVLAHPEVARRTLVLAIHHPAVHDWSPVKARLEGLRDASELLALLSSVPRGLLLHGHLHRRVQRTVPTREGEVHQIGATSASLHHESPDRMAGFNLYEIDASGLRHAEAIVFDPATTTFHAASIPKHV